MPEYVAVQCFQCQAFQANQQTKNNKWGCHVCGAKQSVVRVYARSSSAKDVRKVVQAKNAQKGQQQDMREEMRWQAAEDAQAVQHEWWPEWGSPQAASPAAHQMLAPTAAFEFASHGVHEDRDDRPDPERTPEKPVRRRGPQSTGTSSNPWDCYLPETKRMRGGNADNQQAQGYQDRCDIPQHHPAASWMQEAAPSVSQRSWQQQPATNHGGDQWHTSKRPLSSLYQRPEGDDGRGPRPKRAHSTFGGPNEQLGSEGLHSGGLHSGGQTGRTSASWDQYDSMW